MWAFKNIYNIPKQKIAYNFLANLLKIFHLAVTARFVICFWNNCLKEVTV